MAESETTAPSADPREDVIHQALHGLGVRIPDLKVEGCHCNLITQVILDALGRETTTPEPAK